MLIPEYVTRIAVLGCSGHRTAREEGMGLALVSWYGPLPLSNTKDGDPA